MKISQKTRYGLLFLSELKDNYQNKLISLSTVAKENNIPLPFLKQIALELKKAGIIESKEGANGGYFLAKAPKEIRFSDVINALEGLIELAECASTKSNCCPRQTYCKITKIYQKAYANILSELNKINLGDL